MAKQTSKVTFDLPDYLNKMSDRLEQGQRDLAFKVETGFAETADRAENIRGELVAHAKSDFEVAGETNRRLGTLEDDKKARKWLGRLLVGAAVTMIAEMFVNHVPHLFKP